jgi:hypothetical protein
MVSDARGLLGLARLGLGVVASSDVRRATIRLVASGPPAGRGATVLGLAQLGTDPPPTGRRVERLRKLTAQTVEVRKEVGSRSASLVYRYLPRRGGRGGTYQPLSGR